MICVEAYNQQAEELAAQMAPPQPPAFVREALLSTMTPVEKISAIGEGIKAFLEPGTAILEHWFGEKFTARSMEIEAGSTATSRVHLYEHLTIILDGLAYVYDESGEKLEFRAGDVFVTPPGRCRAFFAVTRFKMLCVWPMPAKEGSDIETYFTVPDMAAYRLATEVNHG